MRAWTLGYAPSYEQAVRIPGNAKAPGGYVFRSEMDAETYRDTHESASRYSPYEMEIPRAYDECVTRDVVKAAKARHAWHGEGWRDYCGVCTGIFPPADHDMLLVEAPLVNPDLGYPDRRRDSE